LDTLTDPKIKRERIIEKRQDERKIKEKKIARQ
jgi:hypothetical protein